MTDDERFDRLATAIERVADVVGQVTKAQLGTQHQIGLLSAEMLRMGERVDALAQQQSAIQQQQAAMLQRQAEQDQRFDVLLGEIRHIVQRLDEGSQT